MAIPTEEKAKRMKEISDLKSEIQKTKKLLQEGRMDELSTHLQKLNIKYLLETGAYNMVNPIPPKNTQENAQNCIVFLSALLTEKIADAGDQK